MTISLILESCIIHLKVNNKDLIKIDKEQDTEQEQPCGYPRHAFPAQAERAAGNTGNADDPPCTQQEQRTGKADEDAAGKAVDWRGIWKSGQHHSLFTGILM